MSAPVKPALAIVSTSNSPDPNALRLAPIIPLAAPSAALATNLSVTVAPTPVPIAAVVAELAQVPTSLPIYELAADIAISFKLPPCAAVSAALATHTYAVQGPGTTRVAIVKRVPNGSSPMPSTIPPTNSKTGSRISSTANSTISPRTSPTKSTTLPIYILRYSLFTELHKSHVFSIRFCSFFYKHNSISTIL